MKIHFALPDKRDPNGFYFFDSICQGRIKAIASYQESIKRQDFYNRSCKYVVISIPWYQQFLRQNGYDYGLIFWNGIMQEIYIAQKSQFEKTCENCLFHIQVSEESIYCPVKQGFYLQDNCCENWKEEIKKDEPKSVQPKEKN